MERKRRTEPGPVSECEFDETVRQYEKEIYNHCYRILHNADDAADQTQETFIRFWKSLQNHSFEGSCSVRTWLYRIATNCSIDCLRQRKRRQESMLSEIYPEEDETFDMPDNSNPLPDEIAESQELAEMLQLALRRLPADQCRILLMREQNELSYQEIAEILNIEIGTVKSRISRARAQLKIQMQSLENMKFPLCVR